MAHNTKVYPEFFKDPRVGKLTAGAKLLYLGCGNYTDRDGVVRWSPAFLRAVIFPGDKLSHDDVAKLMAELVGGGWATPIELVPGRGQKARLNDFRKMQGA